MQAQTAVNSRCRVSACCFSRHRRRSVRVQASTYTQTAQQAIKSAQQEACRQGNMFLAPPHLVLVSTAPELCGHNHWDLVLVARIHTHRRVFPDFPGSVFGFTGVVLYCNVCTQQGLLDVSSCSASKVLTEAGMSAAAAEAAFVDKQALPQHSITTPGDLHWAPDARKALQIAAELCTYTGGCCCDPMAVHDCAPALGQQRAVLSNSACLHATVPSCSQLNPASVLALTDTQGTLQPAPCICCLVCWTAAMPLCSRP